MSNSQVIMIPLVDEVVSQLMDRQQALQASIQVAVESVVVQADNSVLKLLEALFGVPGRKLRNIIFFILLILLIDFSVPLVLASLISTAMVASLILSVGYLRVLLRLSLQAVAE